MFKQSEEISEISKLINFTILFQLLIFPFPESLRNCFHFQLNANFNYVNVSIAYKPINEILSRSRVKNNLTIKIKKNIIRVPSMYIYTEIDRRRTAYRSLFSFLSGEGKKERRVGMEKGCIVARKIMQPRILSIHHGQRARVSRKN